MTEEHYKASIKMIENDYRAKLLDLHRRFAIDANNIGIGDIIHDEPCNFFMLVEQIKIRQPRCNQEFPICTFYGERLRKNLTPTSKLSREYSDVSRCKLIRKKFI